jgi:hypothetical protein
MSFLAKMAIYAFAYIRIEFLVAFLAAAIGAVAPFVLPVLWFLLGAAIATTLVRIAFAIVKSMASLYLASVVATVQTILYTIRAVHFVFDVIGNAAAAVIGYLDLMVSPCSSGSVSCFFLRLSRTFFLRGGRARGGRSRHCDVPRVKPSAARLTTCVYLLST